MVGSTENRALLVLLTRKLRDWPASLAAAGKFWSGETLVAQPGTVCGPESSRTDWSAPLMKLGASLTNATLILNVCGTLVSTPPLAVPPLSCNCTVTVAEPLLLATGV